MQFLLYNGFRYHILKDFLKNIEEKKNVFKETKLKEMDNTHSKQKKEIPWVGAHPVPQVQGSPTTGGSVRSMQQVRVKEAQVHEEAYWQGHKYKYAQVQKETYCQGHKYKYTKVKKEEYSHGHNYSHKEAQVHQGPSSGQWPRHYFSTALLPCSIALPRNCAHHFSEQTYQHCIQQSE